MGYVTIGGLVLIIASGVTLWAVEGPGGYHLHPKEDEDLSDSLSISSI